MSKKKPIPDDLKRFLIKVDRMIDEGAYETTIASDDAIQDLSTSGGLIEEGQDDFGFTYIDESTDGLWELGFSRQEIKDLAKSENPVLELWPCSGEGCPNASMTEEKCLSCAIDDSEDERTQSGVAPKNIAAISVGVSAVDPNFGKIDNCSGKEIAFEIVKTPSVSLVLGLSEKEAAGQFMGIDDDDNQVTQVKLSVFNSQIELDFVTLRLTFTLGNEELLSPGVIVHRTASLIAQVIESPETYQVEPSVLKDTLSLQFHRFTFLEGDRCLNVGWKPDWM